MTMTTIHHLVHQPFHMPPPSPPTGAYNPFGPPPPLEDPDPLIRPHKEYYFPFSLRIEGRNYDIFDEPVDFKIEESE